MVSPNRRLDEASAIAAVTEKLNTGNPTPQVQRVSDLLQGLHEAEARSRALATNITKLMTDKELRQLRKTINIALRRYAWTPVVTDIRTMTPVAAWSLAVADEVGGELPGLHSDPLLPLWAKVHGGRHQDDDEWERAAVWYLIHRGGWNRYRRCKQCGQWFYQRTDFQTFCLVTCRQKFAANSEEFRKKRAVYMRKRYHQQKEDDRKALRRARRKP
jgi:hypothetical protein